MIEEFVRTQIKLVSYINPSFKRYLYPTINWKERCLGILGARGVGKTTLMLQYYKETFTDPKDCLYVSCDDLSLPSIGLRNLAEEFYSYGGDTLILDEIHKYPNWSQELKNIYDSHPEKRIIFSGSSMLDIIRGKYDLSRRVVTYKLQGLSFREYLNLDSSLDIRKYRLADILAEHGEIAQGLSRDVKVLRQFKNYLAYGYYPYFLEGKDIYAQKIVNALEKVLYEDIPSVYPLKSSAIPVLKKIVYLVATSHPFVPNMERISSAVEVSKEYVYYYLDYLEKAGVFRLLHSQAKGFGLLRKPEKIYMDNPNLVCALSPQEAFNQGALRECFFVNQLGLEHEVNYPASRIGDFVVDGKYMFEVGGKGKGTDQIKTEKNAYLACDGIEFGYGVKIPLYLFGLLY